MTHPEGIVKALKENTAQVVFLRREACGECHACRMFSKEEEILLECENPVGAKVGDRVEVAFMCASPVYPTLLLYALPLLGFLIGLFLGYILAEPAGAQLRSLIAFLCALLGATLIYIMLHHRERQGKFSNCTHAKIVRIITHATQRFSA